MASFSRWFGNLSLKRKLFLTYGILIILPLSSYSVFSYVQISNLVKEQTMLSANQLFGEAAASVSNKVGQLVNTLDIVSMDSTINEIISNRSGDYDINEQLSDYQKLQILLSNLERNKELHRIRLYFNNEAIYTDQKLNLFSMKEIDDTEWFDQLNTSGSTTVWFTPPASEVRSDREESRLVSVARFVWNLRSLSQKAGICRIDIPQSALDSILAESKVSDSNIVYLENSRGEMIATSDFGRSHIRISDAALLDGIPEQTWATVSESNRDVLANRQPIPRTDWNLVSVVPLDSVFAKVHAQRNQLLFVMFAIATIAYFLAYYLADISTKRIHQLSRKMRSMQAGDLDVIPVRYGNDEIGQLTNSYNFMIRKISQLAKEQFQSGKALKQAELKTLQAQINPHFLYNSLDLINCLAIDRQVPEISRMVVALTNFYKLGLNKGKEFVPLRDEIHHVRSYVEIQNMRFDDQIALRLDIPEPLLALPILKISLQPLVENAILHGILEKPNPVGTVSISAELREGIVRLTISDDGVGIAEERQERLLEETKESDSPHGFGLRNIQERLKLTYGEPYGLTVASARHEGTTVEIVFPASIGA